MITGIVTGIVQACEHINARITTEREFEIMINDCCTPTILITFELVE